MSKTIARHPAAPAITPRPSKRALWILLALLLAIALPVSAHWADMAAMELELEGGQARAELSLPTPYFAAFDQNHDGRLDHAEFSAGRAGIESLLREHVVLTVGGEPAALRVARGFEAGAGTTGLILDWRWQRQGALGLRYTLFAPDAPAAHCLVSLRQGEQASSLVFNREQPWHALTEPALGAQILQFGLLGLEHIATGYDHLLFLLALLLASSRLPYLLKIVTSFTLAHSITLSLATLGLVSAPGPWVESLIAASILYVVCVEVLWRRKEASWYVVASFGLIHGLGFASILSELALPRHQLLTALLSFNLGIELGQLAFVLLIWVVLSQMLRKPALQLRFQQVCACLIIVIAGFWLFERTLLGS